MINDAETVIAEGENVEKLSKKELNKLARQKKKAEKKAEVFLDCVLRSVFF